MNSADPNALPQVLAFARRFGERHVSLAMHAAVPLGLTPELVHLLRVNFVREADWIAEADLLLSPLCREAGGELYEMEPTVRQILLDEFHQAPDFGVVRVHKIAEFLEIYAAYAHPGTSREMRDYFQALRWGARAELDPAGTARELAEALRRGLEEGDQADAVRIADVAGALSAPLLGERELLVYAAGLRKVPEGNASVLASDESPIVIHGVTLPAIRSAEAVPITAASEGGKPSVQPGADAPKQGASPAPEEPGLQHSLLARDPELAAVAAGRLVLRMSGRPAQFSRGVGALQDALNALAPVVDQPELKVDFGRQIQQRGYFGPKTQAAVSAFQRSAGIAIDGEVGRQTLLTLDRALVDAKIGSGLVYVNYAPEDIAVARRMRDGLERAGVMTWFDEAKIELGNVWREKSSRAIEECSLFLALLSRNSIERKDGAFRMEWHAALNKQQRITSKNPFILPVVVDDQDRFNSEHIPEEFRDIRWALAPAGVLSDELLSTIVELTHRSEPRPIVEPSAERPSHWVLVAGQGSHELPPMLVEIASMLGAALAEAGYGLVVGGWPGVDHIVAREFGMRVSIVGHMETEWLRQVVPRGQKPDYSGGAVQTTDDDWGVRADQADAVILVGGSGGTEAIGSMARAIRKPVLPLAITGGDAAAFWTRVSREWETWPVRGLTLDDFKQIGPNATEPVGAAVRLLEKLFTSLL